MKKILLSLTVLAGLLASSAPTSRKFIRPNIDLDAFREELDKTDLDETIKDKIFFAYSDYTEASSKFKELMELHGLNKQKPKQKTINADVTDPTVKAIREQVRKTRNRFETLKRTINKWGPSTNLTARAAGASFQDKLNAARAEAKALKDMQKAARKFGKNIEKVRKDFEKYRDKAATEDERAFWQSLLDIIPVPN